MHALPPVGYGTDEDEERRSRAPHPPSGPFLPPASPVRGRVDRAVNPTTVDDRSALVNRIGRHCTRCRSTVGWRYCGKSAPRIRDDITLLERFRARRIDIGGTGRAHARRFDGESLEPDRPLTVEMDPAALLVKVPR
ncbi:hypothetical protein R1X32_10120 (plasmid) [Rhodococcus opacus]|uniref:hypothetical protein n=1 Tax=Rhodococcus opacus TaxID=37919 RepID=UPI0034D1A039